MMVKQHDERGWSRRRNEAEEFIGRLSAERNKAWAELKDLRAAVAYLEQTVAEDLIYQRQLEAERDGFLEDATEMAEQRDKAEEEVRNLQKGLQASHMLLGERDNLQATVEADLVYQRRLEGEKATWGAKLNNAVAHEQFALRECKRLREERVKSDFALDEKDRQYRALQSKDNAKRDRIVVLEAQVAVLKELVAERGR
jgi:hypothetical protein